MSLHGNDSAGSVHHTTRTVLVSRHRERRRMGRSQTPTAVRKPPGGIPAYKRHQAIVEAMADVPADVEAWVDVSMGLKMQMKDVQQIHDLLAEADESQGHDWQLRILCQGSARPYRVELVVLRAPLMIPPVKKVLEAPRHHR